MAPLVNRNMQPTARNFRDLIGFWRDGQINMTPPYQRGDVWTVQQRQALIKSLLLGIPVAALVLNLRDNQAWRDNEGDPTHSYAVIDGKQRLTTVRMLFDGDLAVPADWFEPDWIKPSPDGPSWTPRVRHQGMVTWRDFELHAKRYMGQGFIIPVAEARLGSLAEEAEVYGLINQAGTAHTAAELNRARDVARGKK